jgi:hypothetical protein
LTFSAPLFPGALTRPLGGFLPIRPGSSGQLLAQSPHRPLRAQLTHKVLQVIGSLHNKSALSAQRGVGIYGIT